MSDPSPPPKPKPGSLRDRIAAFEKPSSAPPVPRPKPGGVSWKPKAQSPPSSPRLSVDHGNTPEKKVLGGMSAFDAKESIGKGGSLKERMAALQGKGGFGAPPPLSPKPALEKPKWKPPPAVSPPSDDEKDGHEAEQTSHRSDKAPPPAESAADHIPQDTHDDGPNLTVEDDDLEEQERQRRAAIAARMARLGGARVGMAPPVFGKKPSIKRTDTLKEETTNEEESKRLGTVTSDGGSSVKSPPVEQTSDVAEAEQTPDSFPARQNSASSSVLSAESTSSSPAARTPSSMPVPAGPRRAAPPRKKVVKSSPVPESQTLETDAQGAASADSTPDNDGESQKGTHEETATEPSVGANDTHPKAVEEAAHITGEPQSVDIPKPEESHVDTNPVEPLEEPPREASVDIEMGTGAQSIGSRDGLNLDNESQVPSDSAPVMPEAAELLTAEPEEEEEAARRKRVAERLAKMGAFNPFSAPRRQSFIIQEGHILSGDAPSPSHSPDIPRRGSLRKDSIDSVASKSHGPERVEVRKSSLDLATDRPNVPPHPPRAEDLRTNSVDSTLSSPPLPPVAPDLTKSTSTPISRESSAQNDSTEYNVSKEEDESQDEFKGLGDERDVATPYDEYESHEQHEADEETLQGVVEHGHEHESSSVASHEWEVNDAESEYSNDDPSSDANQGPSHDRAEDSENDTSFSQITRVPPPRPTANTQPNIVIMHGESSPPPIVSQTSARSSVVPPQEHKGRQEDKGPAASRPLPPPRVVSEDESALESETELVRPNRSLLPPTRILPHSPEDDYQSESEPKPVPLPRSSRMALLPRPIPYQSEEKISTDTEFVAAPRPHRSIPPPPMENEGQNSPEDDASSLEAEEGWDVEEAEEEILPTPPPRRSLQQDEASHVPTTRKTTLDYEAEELMATIAARSVCRALPESQLPPPVHQPSPLYRTLPSVSVEGHEVLDESEGDPIDPAFHSPSRRGSPVSTPPHPILPPAPELIVETEEDSERARRRTIADRMAKLGGIKFGSAPPLGRPPVQHIEESTPDRLVPAEEASPVRTEEEEEVARKQRIAAKLSSMGGQRFGMLPLGPSGAISRSKRPESGVSSVPPPASLRAAAPPTHDADSEHDSIPSEDGVRVEAEEESELEEVNHEDAQDEEETPPPLPTRAGRSSGSEPRTEQPRKMSYPPVAGGRPPIPAVPPNFLNRRSSIQSTAPTTRVSVGSGSSHYQSPSSSSTARPPSFVMVDGPESFEQEETPPPPPARPTSRVPPSHGAPPLVSNATDVTASQWELPSIPVSSIDFGDGSVDLSLSSWTEVAPSAPPSKPTSSSEGQLPPPVASSKAPPADAQLSADDLMAVWGRVGVQICEVATTLHEKSRKSLVGDGSYHGFVDAVLSQVPNAALPVPPSYGYVVYVQVGSAVQKRASEIMPGDIVMLSDAKFKGHKGIQIYHQNVGAEEPLVGIVNEFEPKKSKIKVFEANQHVGQQTVESVSYRLEDMKSGTVKIFRVLEA